mgnify:CR=1 FL=1
MGTFVIVHSPGISSFSKAMLKSLEPSNVSPPRLRDVYNDDIFTFTPVAASGILFNSIV